MATYNIKSKTPIRSTDMEMKISRYCFALVSFILGLVFPGASVLAANPGDEVIVVYNSRVPESRQIAEYYAERRHVPANQLFGFDLSTNEAMSRAEFRDALQMPLAKALEKKKLWHVSSRVIPATNSQPAHLDWRPASSAIRYAVLCYGVPLRIEKDPHLKEAAAEKLRPELRRDEAAVDSELTLLPAFQNNLPLSGPLQNPFYAVTNPAALHPTNGVLLVARLDGPTAAIARGLVDKALQAENEGLWGRAYFDLRNTTEPGYKMGDDWIRAASEVSRRLGFETVVDENPGTFPAGFPMSQIGLYMGWYNENACGPFAEPTVEFMPGAVAYHLHSYSAHTLRSTNQFWVGPLLAKGVTATMGYVDEPYLAGTADVSVFAARFIYQGFSFGEAACAAQNVLSWQTTIVGDPLYRPFGKTPEQQHVALEASHSKMLEWSYLRLLNLNQASGKPLHELTTLLENLELTKQSAILSEKLGDLYTEAGKPASSIHEYAQALKLNPSPQQKLRLLLTFGAKLTALNREAEAYENYQILLKEFPIYADRATITNKLADLDKTLKKPAEPQKVEDQPKQH